MFQFLTVISAFSIATLAILGILIYENNRLPIKVKRRFYMTIVMIVFAMVVEWLGIFWNGAPEWTRIPHAIVKCLDYIATPMAGICFLNQVTGRTKFPKVIWGVNAVNIDMPNKACQSATNVV